MYACVCGRPTFMMSSIDLNTVGSNSLPFFRMWRINRTSSNPTRRMRSDVVNPNELTMRRASVIMCSAQSMSSRLSFRTSSFKVLGCIKRQNVSCILSGGEAS